MATALVAKALLVIVQQPLHDQSPVALPLPKLALIGALFALGVLAWRIDLSPTVRRLRATAVRATEDSRKLAALAALGALPDCTTLFDRRIGRFGPFVDHVVVCGGDVLVLTSEASEAVASSVALDVKTAWALQDWGTTVGLTLGAVLDGPPRTAGAKDQTATITRRGLGPQVGRWCRSNTHSGHHWPDGITIENAFPPAV